jgi:hypothetical protein
MFHVTTINLSPDTTADDPAHGTADLGELNADEFLALLERFRRLGPVQNREAEPQLFVGARAGKFRVRTSQGKLFVDQPGDPSRLPAELPPAEIARHLDQIAGVPTTTDAPSADRSRERAPSRAIAAALLVAGLSLNAYTLSTVFDTASVNEKPVVALVTDPAEISAHLADAIGTFATGDRPGDRTISVTADGKIRFAELGARAGLDGNRDTFRLGRLGKNYCLHTVDSGVVEVLNLDTLVYYRDVYKRR